MKTTRPAPLMMAMSLPFLAALLRIWSYGRHLYPVGDYAIMDVQVRRALHWHLALGPYDRFGWHHPGPSYLYLISFVARLLGTSHGAEAELVATTIINCAAVLGSVWVVYRAFGQREALSLSVAISVAIAGVGPELVMNPWNPYQVTLLCLLTVSLALASPRLGWAAWLAATMTGSVAIQTDIGSAPLVFVVLAIGAGAMAYTRTSARRPWAPSALLFVLTVCVWIPPLIQQASHGDSGNLSAIQNFFSHPPQTLGLVHGVQLFGAKFGSVVGLGQSPLPSGIRGFVVFPVALAVSLLVAGIARRRHLRSTFIFSGSSAIGIVTGLIAASRISGPPGTYLVEWAIVPGIFLLAALLLCTVPILQAMWASPYAVPATLALAVCVTTGRTVATMNTHGITSPQVAAAWTAIQPVIRGSGGSAVVQLDAASPRALSAMIGLGDILDRHRVRFSVPSWLRFPFGPGHATKGNPSLLFASSLHRVPANYRVVFDGGDLVVALKPN